MLTPEIVTNLLLESIFILFGAIAFGVSLQIVLQWDKSSGERFFRLQKRSYLSSTIIKFVLSFKIVLLLFFIYTLQKLSALINGAMCGVGVLDTSPYGIYLMIVKVINVYLFAFWVALNHEDHKHPYLPYTQLKSLFFLGIYLLMVVEFVLELAFFNAIEPAKVVDCCGVVFSATDSTLMSRLLGMEPLFLYGMFYANVAVMLLSYILGMRRVYAFFGALLVPVALVSLIGYFGTYIYELPTHHCPFCLMQGDYHYVGYFLYTFLFLGSFFAILSGFYEDAASLMRRSLLFVGLYTLSVSLYPLLFRIENGVWLY